MVHAFQRPNIECSEEKTQRRIIVDELSSRHESVLATDYPGETGRDFMRKLLKRRPKLTVTMVNKASFQKNYPGDGLGRIIKIRDDIFNVMLYNSSTLIDIDLFGGFPTYGKECIERAPFWEQILITFSRAWRHKVLKGALAKDEDPAVFMEAWCKEKKWKAPIMPQLPYKHPNKNAILGALDKRGPKYWTFLISR